MAEERLYRTDDIDRATFEQILEMDDDESEREFSRSIVYDFFQQAEDTFANMDEGIDEKDLKKLSELGHFLKGSSATLGLTKVKDSCEKIQHYGAGKDASGTKDVSDEAESLKSIEKSVAEAKMQFAVAERLLRQFYKD